MRNTLPSLLDFYSTTYNGRNAWDLSIADNGLVL